MRINHNIAALNTQRQLSQNTQATQNSLEKLSSGLQINSAADDAAGLAISEKMRGQIRGLEQAQTNAQDGISMIQTAEGALNETHSILQRMRELATQSANDTNTDADRGELQKEVDQLANALNDISNDTEFNTQKLLNGGFEGTFQVGANKDQNLSISIDNMNASNLEVGTTLTAADSAKVTVESQEFSDQKVLQDESDNAVAVYMKGTDDQEAGYYKVDDLQAVDDGSGSYSLEVKSGAEIYDSGDTSSGSPAAYSADTEVNKGIDISSQDSANTAIETINGAIDQVSSERSKLGAVQNRLEHTINNLGTSSQNLTSAESRIRDVDMAKEMMNFTKNNILNQAAQSMLAKANQQPQGVLQLLR